VRSALTQEVNVIEAANVNIHAVLLKVASGQLPFLGSMAGICVISVVTMSGLKSPILPRFWVDNNMKVKP